MLGKIQAAQCMFTRFVFSPESFHFEHEGMFSVSVFGKNSTPSQPWMSASEINCTLIVNSVGGTEVRGPQRVMRWEGLSQSVSTFKRETQGAGRRLRVPSTHLVAPGVPGALFWPLWALHVCDAHEHMRQTTPTQKMKINTWFKKGSHVQKMYEVQESRSPVWYDSVGFGSRWSGDMEQEVRNAERMPGKAGIASWKSQRCWRENKILFQHPSSQSSLLSETWVLKYILLLQVGVWGNVTNG